MSWLVLTSPKPCPYCRDAKQLLLSKGLEFKEKTVQDLRLELSDEHVLEPVTYPQIFHGDTLIGGFDKLRDRLDEPLLDPSLARFTPIPVKHHDVWKMYKQAQEVNWVTGEIDFGKDLPHWNALAKKEQRFLKHILAFFAGADGIVQENLMTNFQAEVQYAEVRAFYAHQGYIESVHAETYGTFLTTYIPDQEEAEELVRGIQTIPSVARKAEWSMKWLDSRRPFAERLIAFICVEGILFSGSFCAIFWMKQRGKLPALTFSNDLISRDEGLHQSFGELLYTRHIRNPLPAAKVHQIIKEAVDTEMLFVREAVGDMKDAHLDAPRMIQYIQYVADRITTTLGYPAIYHASQPFAWMESISLRAVSSFFEKRVEAYFDPRVNKCDKPVFGADDVDF